MGNIKHASEDPYVCRS